MPHQSRDVCKRPCFPQLGALHSRPHLFWPHQTVRKKTNDGTSQGILGFSLGGVWITWIIQSWPHVTTSGASRIQIIPDISPLCASTQLYSLPCFHHLDPQATGNRARASAVQLTLAIRSLRPKHSARVAHLLILPTHRRLCAPVLPYALLLSRAGPTPDSSLPGK